LQSGFKPPLKLARFSRLMSSSVQIMPLKTGTFHDPATGVLDDHHSLMNEYSGEKWPVWLRLLTIVGLSAGLWTAIIWSFVSIFG